MKQIIKYKAGYKYQLFERIYIETPFRPKKPIDTKYISMTRLGGLIIRDGYAWDGPSGPTIDTKNFMRGSLVHDALYQLIRLGFLEHRDRDTADKFLQALCRQDGMSRIRAWWVYQGLKIGGASAASSKNVKKILSAP